MIKKIKGTQDLLSTTLFDFITQTLETAFEQYNFEKIATPIIEPVELFQRTIGKETDIVGKEMFLIEKREGSSETICLRPEATAGVMRAYLENHVQQAPWQVVSHGPMFRYERPQKGRFRQFHQFNIEIINAAELQRDALLISLLDHIFFEKFQLENISLHINFLGTVEDRATYTQTLKQFLQEQQTTICATCKTRSTSNTLRIFDCKNPQCQELYQQAPKITESLSPDSQREWEQLQKDLELLSVSFVINPQLVRGLDYYNKTVFEFVSNDLGAQSTFCGGGRYELATQLGSKHPIPAIGAAIGIERLMLLLEPKASQLLIATKKPLHLILPLSEEQNTLALLLAQYLGQHGFCIDVLFEEGSIKSKFRKANKLGATYCLIVGETEQQNNTITVKNMVTGVEATVTQENIILYLQK